jgi:hypothetical protein
VAENTPAKTRPAAIAPENWADLLSIDVKHQVERAADDINDVEWLRHKNIAEKLREIRTTIGKEHEGNWLAFTRSGVLNISSRQAQDLEAAHDWLQEVPIEQKILQKMSTRSIALAARFCKESSAKEKKILAQLRKGALSEPKIRELGGLLSRAGSGAKARTQKQWEALKQQMEEDADRLADHREWLQAQLKEMVDRLNAIRTDRGMDPVEHPEYDAGEYQGVIDKAMRRDGAVQVAKKEYRTVSVTKNTRAKVLS